MSKKGFDRRDVFKVAGIGVGAGLVGGALGFPQSSSAGLVETVMKASNLDARQLDPNAGLSVVLIGTGTPLPSPDRACASTLVIAGDRTMMVDSGRFSSVRMAQAGVLNPTMLLYTHFHSDHITDFGEVMINRFAMAGADTPLPVIGPVGVKKMVNSLLDAYAPDKQYRLDHHGDAVNEAGYRVEITETEPCVVYNEAGLKITMFEVDHRPVVPAVAYKFEYKGQSVVVSGDTKKVPQMVEMASGCDILVHEAMNKQMIEMAARANDSRRSKLAMDILDYHTMTDEVAEIARDAGVKKLVLTHMVPSPINRAMEHLFTHGMHKIYRKRIIVGRDLMEIKA